MFHNRIVRAILAAAVILLLIAAFIVRFKHVDANERGVKVGINGLVEQPIQPGVSFYCPLTTKFFVANVGQQRFVMDNTPSNIEKVAQGREKDQQVFRSKDNQDMYVEVAVQWHRDPSKVVKQQSEVGNVENDEYFVETVLRQPVMTATKNTLTVLTAIEAYSGAEHVKAQEDILKALQENKTLQEKGCVVDSYIVEVKLDDAYTKPIKDRQTAMQQRLAYDEQKLAADSNALKAKAEAQADLNTQVVGAERDKQIAVLRAEQEKQKVVLVAQGEKEAAQNRADAILAIGKANAEAERLKYSAYSTPGAETFAKLEMSKQLSVAYSGVKGYVPEKMTINTFSETFLSAVNGLVAPPQVAAPTR